MTAKMYADSEISLLPLKGKRVAILGFGNQAHAHALNLKESGIDVVVGLREGSPSQEKAEALGFTVTTLERAVQQSDLVMMLIPDEQMASAYRKHVQPHLRAGQGLGFCHGFAVRFAQLDFPQDIDVFLVAPKGSGHALRKAFLEGSGLFGIFAIEQRVSADIEAVAMAYAKGIGCTRLGLFETTFKEETETDLFGEQVVLCGGLPELIRHAFGVLLEAGYQPEMAYFEVLYECKLIVDLMLEKGLSGMRQAISNTAEYGGYLTGPKVVGLSSRKAMEEVLAEIQSGAFAQAFMQDTQSGNPDLTARRLRASLDETEAAEEKIRRRLKGQV